MWYSTFILSCLSTAVVAAGLSDSNLEKHVNVLNLDHTFGPVKEAYWTGYPHHRRTPFAVSPDGKSAYLAYLDQSETDVHIQQVDPSTFAAVGSATTVTGAKEAGGLVAHNDGFALLTNEALPSGTANAPADNTPVPVLYRYTSGKQSWKTYLGGPSVKADMGLEASPDLNGDLAYSEKAGLYGAYFVVTAYSGSAQGHFGDAIQYVKSDGTLQTIAGATSTWGCSHNTGIAFEAADAAPFASLCAEDQGEIWLNTGGTGMSGVKVSNENVTNGASNEAMGGMSGSYSGLARFINKDSYIFTWVSRGAINLKANEWLGGGNTQADNRTVNRNVAIALFSDKKTLVGQEASSTIGAADGDSQVNWITSGSADCSNAHVAAFDGENAVVTWEEIANPTCDFLAMGCRGAFTGSYFQLVNNGEKVGEPIKSMDTFVAGDMVTMSDGRVCWPYVNMTWTLDSAVAWGGSTATTKQISFACIGLSSSASGSTGSTPVSSAAASSSEVKTPASSAAPVASTSVVVEAVSTPEPVASTAEPVASSAAAEISTFSLLSETALPTIGSDTVATPAPSAEPTVEPVASSVVAPVSSAAAETSEAAETPVATAAPVETAPADEECGGSFPTVPSVPTAVAVPTTLVTRTSTATGVRGGWGYGGYGWNRPWPTRAAWPRAAEPSPEDDQNSDLAELADASKKAEESKTDLSAWGKFLSIFSKLKDAEK